MGESSSSASEWWWEGDSGFMALKGRFCCEILEVLEQAIPAENVAGGEDFPRRLVGDDVALMVALKRENAMGANEG
jgi:hypothetical protein